MRLAIVAASSYEENGQVAPIPNAELDVELFGRRLAEPDAGFIVHAFDAQRGLPEGIEELARHHGGRARSLIFYFWGYALLSSERGATLLLDGPKLSSFTLARLRRLLQEVADEALVVLDATLAAGSEGAPLDVVRAMGAALSGGDSVISSLISVRPPQRRVEQGPPPFTGLVQMILDAQTGSPTALTPETLFRAMQSEEVMFADIPAAGCFLARQDFVVVPGAAPSLTPPPSRLPAPTSLPPPPPVLPPARHAYDETEEVTAKRAVAPPPPPPPLPPPNSAAPIALVAVPPSDPVTVPIAQKAPFPPPPSPIIITPPSSMAPAPGGAHSPDDPAGYRFLFNHFQRKGEVDAAYRAALCLEALGEADINESLLVSQHEPAGMQAVRGTLSYADWNERLSNGAREPEVTALLRAISGALPRVGFQHVRRQRQDRDLGEEHRQELEKSTTTLAKTLHWASRLLCVPVSELYVLPELPGSLGLTPGPERPLVACARSLGSGFSLPELVFLWSRELAFARPEETALCYFPTVSELTQLLLAALAVGGNASMRSIDGDAKRLASALKREVRGPELDALQSAASRLEAHDVGRRAGHFVRGAELVAGRVGLAASGSVSAALALSARFPRGSATSAAERRADLLRFAVSPELGQVRAELGVAVA
ncbi:MAG: domain protein putative component of TonB system [Polyangiaceae bacterium]|jgi:hypothetical protein|nr:domain protein putative component of TonB system [Polyangiaceae bacterium]